MAASDPVGGNKFWFNGIPYTGVAKSGTDTAGVKYWFNGVPVDTLLPAAAAAATTYAAFSIPQDAGRTVARMVGY